MHAENTNETEPIAFAIVTYREPFYDTVAYKSLKNSLLYLSSESCRIYIYDNTDQPQWQLEKVNPLINQSIFYFHNPENPGLSVAYNFLARKAMEDGMKWIVLLDQDTSLPPDAAAHYTTAAVQKEDVYLKAPVLKVGNNIFSPHRYFLMRSIPLKNITSKVYSLNDIRVINSGMMIYLPFFFKTGGYNESIKLDFTDFQFLARAKKYTGNIELLPIICQQNFSHDEQDLERALVRYRIYLTDWMKCHKPRFNDVIGYSLVCLTHLVKMSMKFKSLVFMKTFVNLVVLEQK